MSKLMVAATQMVCTKNLDQNISTAERLVFTAAEKGARIILLQELFETLYFCQEEKAEHFKLASALEENKAVNHFCAIAKKLKLVLPISFFEKKNAAHYNTTAVIDADGSILGIYRKTHIPDGPGYEEKFYFNPGDTGFKVWRTKYACIGVGICWDQWFPEAARIMALKGAQILFYPTAIGSEPAHGALDSKAHWQTAMQGHSACNLIPVVASNRIGTESFGASRITFYGSSFITDNRGQILQQANRTDASVILSEFDLDQLELQRASWGLFRDRRPSQYKTLLTSSGE
ncbi:MAG: N-carbamoylputrescine amidase [Proteobacteria bacterium]|nr:N-carbamoylputrescine amidase [Desulfobacula sp.]MBU3952287.1 N-carbamoylputrescine amidase [Pseudomonadota bacterium]MBU4133072.1 N-carbamoylputrescine amidase [Pseudomonadota bacterium]